MDDRLWSSHKADVIIKLDDGAGVRYEFYWIEAEIDRVLWLGEYPYDTDRLTVQLVDESVARTNVAERLAGGWEIERMPDDWKPGLLDDWIPVESSHLDGVQYNLVTQELLIRFKDQQVYRYDVFTMDDWLAFARSESKGKHFHAHIKDKFPTTKVSDGTQEG